MGSVEDRVGSEVGFTEGCEDSSSGPPVRASVDKPR